MIQGHDDIQCRDLSNEIGPISGVELNATFTGTGLGLADGHIHDAGVPVDPSVAFVPDLPASDGGVLRIVAAYDMGGGMYEYDVKRVDNTGVISDLCVDGPAIPTWGVWLDNGDNIREPGRNKVTFACPGTAVYKCQDWGWSSWTDPERHHACTRMARNDICGDGTPHTMAGTMIRQYDANDSGVNPFQDNATVFDVNPGGSFGKWIEPPPMFAAELPLDKRYFEAGWTATATVLRKHTRYTGHAVCLSKLRWQAMPVGGLCPTTLPDPRTSEDPVGYYCEDYENISDLELNADALLVNESLYNDVPLLRWVMPNGYQYSTPFSDFTTNPNGAPGSPVADEGLILTENGYNALINSGDYTAANFAPLETYYRATGAGGAEYVTTTGAGPSTFSFYRTEGYIFTDLTAALDFESKSSATRAELYLDTDGTQYITTTTPVSATPVLLGYVFYR